MTEQSRFHCLLHEPYEGIGCIADWLQQNNCPLTVTRLFADEPLPALSAFDRLVIMGGAMSVHDEAKYPWLAPEKTFIDALIRETDIPILGICLGAQLIAHVLGARAVPNPHKEIGWFPVQAEAHSPMLGMPASLNVFHWHGDTFSMPPQYGALRLASSEACQNQLFCVGNRIWGFQFHPEVTPETIEEMLVGAGDELAQSGKYVQSEQQIRDGARYCREGNKILFNLLDNIQILCK